MRKTRFHPERLPQYLLLSILFAYAHPVLSADKDADTNQQLLQPYAAEYVLRKKGFTVGLLQYHLTQQPAGYVFTAEARPTGLATLFSRASIREKSILEWNNGTLVPQWYNRSYDGKPDDKIKNMQINYNRQSGLAEILLGNEKLEFKINGGLWDTSSVQVALMHDLALGRQQLDYRVIDNDKLVEHHYSILGTEEIESNTGPHQTLKLEYRNGSRQTLFWCDVNRGYIPVKMQRYKKGKLDSELLLQSLTVESESGGNLSEST